MPLKCSVPKCHAHFNKKNKVTVFAFPKSEEKRQEWIRALPCKDYDKIKHARVCERHFRPDDIEWITSILDYRTGRVINAPLARLRLKSDAVPSIFPKYVPYTESSGHKSKFKYRIEEHQDNIGVLLSTVKVPVEVILPVSNSSSDTHVPSPLPAIQSLPEDFEFSVSFSSQEKNNEDVSWTYSNLTGKLYVGKDVPFPINFSANTVLSNDVFIRAKALYCSPNEISEDIQHSENQSMGAIKAELPIQCDSSEALYEVDHDTHQHSVIVPFKNYLDGQEVSTYNYKFSCFEICTAAPNPSRPLVIIFTLEKKNQVIVERKLDVLMCDSPGRERKSEENMLVDAEIPLTVKSIELSEFVLLSDAMKFTNSVVVPRATKDLIVPNGDGIYAITVDTLDCYEFLEQMKKFYEICRVMKNLPSDIKRALIYHHRRKE